MATKCDSRKVPMLRSPLKLTCRRQYPKVRRKNDLNPDIVDRLMSRSEITAFTDSRDRVSTIKRGYRNLAGLA